MIHVLLNQLGMSDGPRSHTVAHELAPDNTVSLLPIFDVDNPRRVPEFNSFPQHISTTPVMNSNSTAPVLISEVALLINEDRYSHCPAHFLRYG